MKPVKNVTSATVMAAASGVPSAGQLIGDRYRLDRPLERGAMGSVWRAEQIRLRAPVAVKFLDPSLIGDREMHDRFIQEARSAAAVRSAHVVQVFDYGSEGGVPYIAMELLDGENLDARLSARGTLSPAEMAKLFSELARGIGQAHAIGVIHRDLKPGNIFIAREGEHEVTKIVDFGIAKVKASALRLTQGIGTQLGTLLGTPQYMSPEQVRGTSSIDHRTDLWALAIIACECLTGRCPFSGATIGDLTVQICTEKPPAPSSLGPVPAGFDQWFFKATQKKPSKRFQTVEEMADRLLAVLAPAVLADPAANKPSRLMLPSRSEVRLAYSAVVTWKGYVVSHLSQGWVAFRGAVAQLIEQLRSRWDVLYEQLVTLMRSERFAFMRPAVERHGLFASVALLCSGILLLGLSSRSSGPADVVDVSQMSAQPDTVTLSALPAAAARIAAKAEATAEPGGAAPAAVEPPAPAAVAPPENAALTAPAALRAEVLDIDDPASLGSAPRASDPGERGTARVGTTSRATADEAAREATPAAGKKPKLITKAMAQAAAKILNADELVASLPPKASPAAKKEKEKAPAAAPQARQRAVAHPATPRTTTKPSSLHPFDDRL
jgi:serine/threonine-protein kinase